MLKKAVRLLLIALLVVVAVAGVLYAFGARVVFDGGGRPYVSFVESVDERAEEIARHRAAQRAQAPAPAADAPVADAPVAAAPAADAPVPAAAPGSEPADVPQPVAAAASEPGAQSVPVRVADRRASAYWTDFRGPARDGRYTQGPIRTDWPSGGLKPIWKQPIGGGYASFVIASGRAFTIEQRGRQEVVAAYDVPTGRELWTNSWNAFFQESMGGDGPRATPTWADGSVYALGATGELRRIDDRTGQTVWRTNILQDAGASNLQWGMAAAPLVAGDTVIVLPGGRRGQSVVAYDRNSGRRVWAALDDQQAYSSPMRATLYGVEQVLVFSASRLMGLRPGSGEVLWEYPWKTSFDVNASQPIVIGGNRVFVSTGYGTGAAVIELTPTEDGRASVREVWRNIRMKNQFTSSVLHDGYIYGLDESILACVDADTGDLKWKGGRYGYGQTMLAGDHLIVVTEQGDLVLVRATPERHEEVARFPALEGKTWNHPAMSDGYLLVRNATEMAAFDLRPAR